MYHHGTERTTVLSCPWLTILTLTALKYFCINHGDQRVLLLSYLALSASFEYLSYGPLSFFLILSELKLPAFKVGARGFAIALLFMFQRNKCFFPAYS